MKNRPLMKKAGGRLKGSLLKYPAGNLLFNRLQPSRKTRHINERAKDPAMKTPISVPFAMNAILTLAEIKAAVEAFDRGDANVFDALDAILVAVEAHQAVTAGTSWRDKRGRDAA